MTVNSTGGPAVAPGRLSWSCAIVTSKAADGALMLPAKSSSLAVTS